MMDATIVDALRRGVRAFEVSTNDVRAQFAAAYALFPETRENILNWGGRRIINVDRTRRVFVWDDDYEVLAGESDAPSQVVEP